MLLHCSELQHPDNLICFAYKRDTAEMLGSRQQACQQRKAVVNNFGTAVMLCHETLYLST